MIGYFGMYSKIYISCLQDGIFHEEIYEDKEWSPQINIS